MSVALIPLPDVNTLTWHPLQCCSQAESWVDNLLVVCCVMDSRAELRTSFGQDQRLFVVQVYLIWQEDWTSSPFSRSRYIRGKVVYQRDVHADAFFARPYIYKDSGLSIPADANAEEVAHRPMCPVPSHTGPSPCRGGSRRFRLDYGKGSARCSPAFMLPQFKKKHATPFL